MITRRSVRKFYPRTGIRAPGSCVIKLRVSSRTLTWTYNRGCVLFLSLPPPTLSSIRFTSAQIRVTLNDLFDPVGRTYICKMPFVLRARLESVFPNEASENFGILCRRDRRSCAYAIDSRLIPDRRNVSVFHPRSEASTDRYSADY